MMILSNTFKFLILIFVIFFTNLNAQVHNKTLPADIDISKNYLFYLHGKIVEDQGAKAVSQKYGPYKYEKIVSVLKNHGFIVISEVRTKDTNPWEYAKKVVRQITTLLEKKVPAKNIMVVGASKGAGITVLVSHLLKNREINFVPMAICSPQMIEFWQEYDIFLHGNILSIYDEKDELAGSCEKYFEICKNKGLKNYKEIILKVGFGHGILYQPLDEWINPVTAFAKTRYLKNNGNE